MTLLIVDVSRHQVERADPLDLEKAAAAGINIVNIQLDRGRQQDVLPAWAPEYAQEARSLGLGISTYRWLDSRLHGADSARRAYDRMHALGGPDGMAHVVDCEADATERQLRDYRDTMVALLGRPITLYSGRWWLSPRGWRVADIFPWLWSAPSSGYLGANPGDQSPHWRVLEYGGFSELSVMQYAVSPLPGTGDCSLSAIRDPAVWVAMTGGKPAMRSLNMQVLTRQSKAKWPGIVIYGVGDLAHQQAPSGHNEDDTPGSKAEDQDADSIPEHRALDWMLGAVFTYAQAMSLVIALVTNPENRKRLLYVIFDGWIWRRNGGWVREVYTGSDKHRNHVHASGEADDDENQSEWILDISIAKDSEMNPFFVKHPGNPTVYLSNTMTYRTVVGAEFAHLRDVLAGNGVNTTIWEWSLAVSAAKGVCIDSLDDPPVGMSDEDLERLAAEVVEGLPQAFTLAEIEAVVDRQLDQQSRGGADEDA